MRRGDVIFILILVVVVIVIVVGFPEKDKVHTTRDITQGILSMTIGQVLDMISDTKTLIGIISGIILCLIFKR